MTVPEWLKPAAYGFVAGAIAISTFGFAWGGWMTSGKAHAMANGLAKTQVTAALVPVCVEQAHADPQQAAKLATISAEPKYKRRDALMKAGWATMPGATDPDRNLADACLTALNLDEA